MARLRLGFLLPAFGVYRAILCAAGRMGPLEKNAADEDNEQEQPTEEL